MEEHFFKQINTDTLVELINKAEYSLCYAAPGLQLPAAKAIVELAKRISPELIQVFLDVNEDVLRMGYGEVESINLLKSAGIQVKHMPSLRNGLVVSDDLGYSYTPTALFLEKESTDNEALNGMRLMPAQIKETLARLSPASKSIAVAQAKTEEEKERINSLASENQPKLVDEQALEIITKNITAIPPEKFDVARQVRVFQPYFQYVELSLTGAAIHRHKIKIPKQIQGLGSNEELEGRLNTTFDLIKKGSNFTSKDLENELYDIRENLTKSLGGKQGRVVLTTAKPILEKRLKELKEKIGKNKEGVKTNLDKALIDSMELVVNHYMNIIKDNVPDAFYGSYGDPTEENIKKWLTKLLSVSLPETDKILDNIKLEVCFKDVTYHTLNEPNFLKKIMKLYPDFDWDKPYEEFLAAGEQNSDKNTDNG